MIQWRKSCSKQIFIYFRDGRNAKASTSTQFEYTVVLRYNDHFYNGNFDFRRNFFENGSFLIQIYYILTEFTLSDTDDDSRQRIAFFYTFFIHMIDR